MDLGQNEFDLLRSWIHRLCGLRIPDEKAYLVQHRLEPVARAADCDSFAKLLARLPGAGGASLRDEIIEAVTTNETSFFRDSHPFDAMRLRILPTLVDEMKRRKRASGLGVLRIWCAGVSTGQEAYSLAITLDEEISSGRIPGCTWDDFSILATDVSTRVLATASAGRYSDREIQRGLSETRRNRYFARQGAEWVVAAELRRRIEFRRLNLIEPFDKLGCFDVILCRNVLIYFDDDIRSRIYAQFASLLPIGGVLLLGAMESLVGLSVPFSSEHFGDSIIYRRC